MNEFERAVVEAARALAPAMEFGAYVGIDEACIAINKAVSALDAHEKANADAGISEVEWATVAEGDQLRAKSGAFYPVVSTKREWKMGSATGKFLVTVQLPTGPKILTRPTPAEPRAIVRRGGAGRAVDQFVHVFTSGDRS